VSVTEVKLDGEVLEAEVDYTVVGDLLARLNPDDPTAEAFWPSCQNIATPDTEVGTFSVTYAWGASPPALGFLAAVDLSCVLVGAACGNADCLPTQNLVSKTAGGTTMNFIPPSEPVMKQLPRTVQMFIDAYMPDPIARRQPKLRRPNSGWGMIWTPPTTAAGYQRAGWMGGACIGCS
jgi:hypothetical protein